MRIPPVVCRLAVLTLLLGLPEAPAARDLEPPASAPVVAPGYPWVNFREGPAAPGDPTGPPPLAAMPAAVQPRALAAGDLDEDGVPDLVSSYAGREAGLVVVHRGNIDALHPYAPAAQARRASGGYTDAPFLSPASVFPVPEPADLVAVGNFHGGRHLGVLTAARGGTALYWLPGDGRGGLGEAQPVKLPGAVTALLAADVNRPDGVVDLVLGLDGPDGPALVVLESPRGALRATPEVLPMPGPVTGLALGHLDGDAWPDLAVLAGGGLVVVHGRDRRLTQGPTGAVPVSPATVEAIALPGPAAALAIGAFSPEFRQATVVLLRDGSVHAVRAEPNAHGALAWVADFRALGPWSAATQVITARVSTRPPGDVILVDPQASQLHVLLGAAGPIVPAPAAADVPVALAVNGGPVAALPMDLGADALSDLVVLRADPSAPLIVYQTEATKVVTVNSAGDGPDPDLDDGQCEATLDQGDCTLRAALQQPVPAGGSLEIRFALPGPPIIITDGLRADVTVTIDGTTQPTPVLGVAVGNYVDATLTIGATTQPGRIPVEDPTVELRYSKSGFGGMGLNLREGSTVKGMLIRGFNRPTGGIGIELGGTGGHKIQRNIIGKTGSGGVNDEGNGIGIRDNQAGANLIGGTAAGDGNLISGNRDGILLLGGSGNKVHGNYLGTDRAGRTAVPNTVTGITVRSSDNKIGGTATTEGARNVISGNEGTGVFITGGGARGNRVQANYIGTDATGLVRLENAGPGVQVQDAPDNTIGGPMAAEPPFLGNVISGNANANVRLTGTGAARNKVQGNFIGVDKDGRRSLSGGFFISGVSVEFGSDNEVGGPGAGNVISGNDVGVRIFDQGATNNKVKDNFIGPDFTGAAPLAFAVGNRVTGVAIEAASNSVIGGTADGEANTIAFNIGRGVGVGVGVGNRIQGNKIYRNGALGIDLGFLDAVTANDPVPDPDTGPNNLQNFPVLLSALAGTGGVRVQARLDSVPSKAYHVDFFSNTECDPSGHGEGEIYLGSKTVDTDVAGITDVFEFAPNRVVAAGRFITATATRDDTGDTSEFSACLAVAGPVPPAVRVTPRKEARPRGPGVAGPVAPPAALGFLTGERLTVDVTVDNPGPPLLVDVYAGLVLPAGPGLGCPAGDPLVFLTDNFSRFALTCVSAPPRTFLPVARGVMLPTITAAVTVPDLFGFAWPPEAPVGPYTIFVLLTLPDAFADGFDPSDLAALGTAEVSFSP